MQPFQQPERVLGFFNAYREGKRVTKRPLTEIADQFHYWVKNRSVKWGVPILEPSVGDDDESRRDKLLDAYFHDAKPNQVVAILKAREPARILIAVGDQDNDSPHLEYKQRWVNQFNFYVNDPHWGRMFVRMCPYFPFSARVCLNQHNWLAIRMTEGGHRFPTVHERVLEMQRPGALTKTCRLAYPSGSIPVRPEGAGHVHSILHRHGTEGGWLSASPVLRSRRVLRQSHLPSTGSGRRPHPTTP